MLGNSIKNGSKNLYLHLKPFKTTCKSNSYLVSISRRGPVTPSTSFFHNLTKTIRNLLCCLKNHWEMAAIIVISTLLPLMRNRNCFLIWHRFPGKSINSHFSQYQSYKSNDKITCCVKNHRKMAAISSISTLIPSTWSTNNFLTSRHFPVANSNFRQYQSYRSNECNIIAWKFDQKRLQESLFAL